MTKTNHVAVLLGYKNEPNGQLHPISEQRVDKAFEVVATQQCKLICTGGFGDNFNQSGTAHADLLKARLIEKGIDESQFLPVSLSRNTYEDGKLTAKTLDSHSVTTLHLITSDFHIQRGYLWMKLFMPDFEVICHPAKTIADAQTLQNLLLHEQQAIKNFYRDFPDFPRLDELENWEQFDLPKLVL